MLFTKNQTQNYQLWTATRCAWVLGFGITLFFIFVFLCLILIQVRPSVTVTLSPIDDGIEITFTDLVGAQRHDLTSIDYVRIIHKDQSIAQVAVTQAANTIKIPPLDAEHDLKLIRSSFIIFTPRSLWTFMWERW